MRYRQSADLLVRKWGNEVVIFNISSSDTYQLDPFSFEILNQLRDKACSADDLCSFLLSSFSIENSDELAQSVRAKLRDLERLDLVDIEYIEN